MRNILVSVLICLTTFPTIIQAAPSKYQHATIMEVKPHQPIDNSDPSLEKYDVTLKVGNTLYTVLYTQPTGTYGVQYRAGMDRAVLVEAKTITFNDLLGNSKKVPILSHKTVPAHNSKH